ncbi:hypothetical protein KCP69_22100 [Salmonella enterica subsp. enterica]|nr:hypothetical protein KCP69_22100 [Salmonella enterica subsp. enterica]
MKKSEREPYRHSAYVDIAHAELEARQRKNRKTIPTSDHLCSQRQRSQRRLFFWRIGVLPVMLLIQIPRLSRHQSAACQKQKTGENPSLSFSALSSKGKSSSASWRNRRPEHPTNPHQMLFEQLTRYFPSAELHR